MTEEITKFQIGINGVKLAKIFCKENEIPFHPASEQQDLKLGIDCYVDNIPTDVKLTKNQNHPEIYFLKFSKITNQFTIRHPFAPGSEATHYFFVGSDKEKYLFREIHNYVPKKYFKDYHSYTKFLQILMQLHEKKVSQTFLSGSLHNNQAFWVLKLRILDLLKKDYNMVYSDEDDHTKKIMDHFYFRLQIR